VKKRFSIQPTNKQTKLPPRENFLFSLKFPLQELLKAVKGARTSNHAIRLESLVTFVVIAAELRTERRSMKSQWIDLLSPVVLGHQVNDLIVGVTQSI
jgi:hypothetical protein